MPRLLALARARVAAIARTIRSWSCEHHFLMAYDVEGNRRFLRCVRCHHETPGWTMNAGRSVAR